MAESAAKSAINLLAKILVEEGKHLFGAEGKIEEVLDELLWMQSFLREADTIQFKNETVGMWVSQIKKHVYEAEDIIEDFIINISSRRQQTGFFNKLQRYSCILEELCSLHHVASSIDSLKGKIATLSPKLEKYGINRPLGINRDKAHGTLIEQVQKSHNHARIVEKKIIGLEKDAKEIIASLKSETPSRGYLAIYGKGGLGKTTLATKVFHSDEIKQHFTGGQAFVYIPKQFEEGSVLGNILRSLRSESFGNLPEKDLEFKLQEILRNDKCLVVLDDVRTQQVWDRLKSPFISCGGDSGSKVLLITRKEEVARHVDYMALPKPHPLNKEERWKLFENTMGWHDVRESSTTWTEKKESSTTSTEKKESSTISTEKKESSTNKRSGKDETKINESSTNVASQTMKLGEEMVKVCEGLPLFIIVLGGILRKKQSLEEWHSVHNKISSFLRIGYDNGRSCTEILLQSYDDLAYHLKSCFLHLANFPEDYEIQTDNLYWMWIAEGLVTKSIDGNTVSKSVEDVANSYLTELAQDGLVEVMDKTKEGWIKSIRMHNLVRDVCREKATCENFVETIEVCGRADTPPNVNYSLKRLLRTAIYFSRESEKQVPQFSKAHKYIRSLLLISYEERVGEQWIKFICNEFKVLRVLVLKGKCFNRLPNRVRNLTHLRYLSLAGSDVAELPSSIGKLRFLEILDLRVNGRLEIPSTWGKLFRLRHLILPDGGYQIKRSKKMRVDTLSCLETLENLLVNGLGVNGLKKLGRLRRLSIKDVVCEEAALDMIQKCPAIKSGSLRSCSFSVTGDVISNKASILSEMDVCKLHLMISGPILAEVMNKVEFCQYLEAIELECCRIEDDPMRILGKLHHLKSLILRKGSYVGKKMSCSYGNFPLLNHFEMRELENLEAWVLVRGSMRNLERLEITDCDKLSRFPDVLPASLKHFMVNAFGSGPREHDNGTHMVNPYKRENWSEEDLVLLEQYDKVVISGKGGAGKATIATHLFMVSRKYGFDAFVWVCLPRRCNMVGCLPRRVLHKLLRGLNPKLSREDMYQLSNDNLTDQIQEVMRANKCLVILLNLEDVDHHIQGLDKTFGRRCFERGSKLVITSCKEPLVVVDAEKKLMVRRVFPPTNYETWGMFLDKGDHFCDTNPGIKWNLLRHCSSNPLSTKMLVGLLKLKDDITEWATKHLELTNSVPLQFSQLFSICYDDLPPHLRPCLIYLANFPEDVEISTKKLCRMWIDAGFVRSKDDDAQTKEDLENLASSYLTELEQRCMVTVLKRGRTKRVKTCQLKFALRNLCLGKAKQEHFLMVPYQPKHINSASIANIKTQQLAIHLDQISSASLEEQLSSLKLITSATSLVIFSNINDPMHNEEKWDWLLYICKHFLMLRVFDVEGMWTTKGRLPKEVGSLRQLRYLSLRGTWVTELPPSIQFLKFLQTLDLRVMEPIVIPDVLFYIDRLMHLYLPDKIAKETAKLRLLGLNCLHTLANLHTDKVRLDHLCELKLLRKMSIKKIHAADDELHYMLKPLFESSDLEVSFDSEIINANQTILSSFQDLLKLKIKGRLSVELHPKMFPIDLEELTLQHTKLEEDPLPVLEKLPQLKSLCFLHDSFLGKTMKMVSEEFYKRATLTLCSLTNLEQVHLPIHGSEIDHNRIVIIDCSAETVGIGQTVVSCSNQADEEEQGLRSLACWWPSNFIPK